MRAVVSGVFHLVILKVAVQAVADHECLKSV